MRKANQGSLPGQEAGGVLPLAQEFEGGPKRSRGALHDLLTAKLPDFRGLDGVCDVSILATKLGVTRQAIERWMTKGQQQRLPFRQVRRIVVLSQQQTLEGLSPEQKKIWVEAIPEDFIPFIS